MQINPIDFEAFPSREGILQVVSVLNSREVMAAVRESQRILPSQLVGAVDQRKAEYSISRACARYLLGRLGASSLEVGTGQNREPLWPEGFVGSIAHTKLLVAVAVAKSDILKSIGIDCEMPVDVEGAKSVFSLCIRAEEVKWLTALHGISQELILTLIFSAKEAFFKCLYPLGLKYFDFKDAVVENINIKNGDICLTLDINLCPELQAGLSLVGKFRIAHGHVFTIFEI
jgi:enterobactin synthetase component D